jgi:hypothetical protein
MDRTPRRKQGLPEDVPFPVTPMLDMAFQLLAFFILTFQAPTRETRIDLYLPSAPIALPGADRGGPRRGRAAGPNRTWRRAWSSGPRRTNAAAWRR